MSQIIKVPGRLGAKGQEHRVNFLVSEDTWEKLNDLAQSNNVTVSSIIRDAISLELWFNNVVNSGEKLFVTDEGEYKEVAIK